MRFRELLFVLFLSAGVLGSCRKTSEQRTPVLELTPASISAGSEGGIAKISVKSSASWRVSSDAGWVEVTPSSCPASKKELQVSVKENSGPARTATLTVRSLHLARMLKVSQEGMVDDGIERLTVQQFRNRKDSSKDWYRLTGEVVSIADSGYGDLYLMDGTGFVYVYGLAPFQGGSNEDFVKLDVKAGDMITIVAKKKTYKGVVETDGAYLEYVSRGEYPGSSSACASASWLELPQTSGEDAYDFICHLTASGGRNYSAYYDKAARVARWVAYPLTAGDKNSGRSDAYAFDPLIGEEDQPMLSRSSYQKRNFNGDEYIRGHMVPSYDRGGRSNLDVFLSTNIMPQSTALNGGVWGDMENMVRTWARNCDTLYVVAGTDLNDARLKVEDTRGYEITVPSAIFKAVLAYSRSFGYKGLAAYFANDRSDASAPLKEKCISIDELEKKTGIDFFVNLPDNVEDEVEAQDPASVTWWW